MEDVRTGDVLLFSSNNPTAFLLRLFTSSLWSHVGIAIRIKDGEITINQEGDLYVLETNTGERFDVFNKEKIKGVGLSPIDWARKKYNRIDCRPLHPKLRTEEFRLKTNEFIQNYKGVEFPTSILPFISVWLGISVDKKYKSDQMFCSEIATRFYDFTLGAVFDVKDQLSPILGDNLEVEHELVRPGDFSQEYSPESPVFTRDQTLIYQAGADLFYVISQPLILTIFIVVLFLMLINQWNLDR